MNEPKLYKEIYVYDPTKLTQFDADVFRLRPSSIESFFTCPVDWYKEHVLKQGKTFEGNTGSVLGTTLHYCYECALTNKSLKREDIDDALDYYYTQQPTLFDLETVKDLYPKMLNAVLDGYINPLRSRGVTLHVEEELYKEVGPKFVMRGLADLRYNTTVVDWKNEAKKPSNLDKIPFKYRIQLLSYAYMLRERGIYTDTIEIVYAVRPTIKLGARCFPVKERITQEDWKLIENTVQLIHDSVKICKEKPELTHLIFKSMSLKQDSVKCSPSDCVNCPRR